MLAAVAFTRWTATSPWSFPRFLVALGLLVYLPGRALYGRAGSGRPLDDLAVSLGLGTLAATAAFRLAAALGQP
ncbi:MAG TPA: hypothetical protein VFO85_12440, partial [Vicinamibacteria bacterium]|nr:hypothetical protein [Vicinamibacteria bacterium]